MPEPPIQNSSRPPPCSLLPRSILPAPLARFPCHHKPPEHQEPSSPCSSAPPTPSSSCAPPMAPSFPSTSTPPPRTPVPKHHLARLLPQAGARPAAGDLALRRPRQGPASSRSSPSLSFSLTSHLSLSVCSNRSRSFSSSERPRPPPRPSPHEPHRCSSPWPTLQQAPPPRHLQALGHELARAQSSSSSRGSRRLDAAAPLHRPVAAPASPCRCTCTARSRRTPASSASYTSHALALTDSSQIDRDLPISFASWATRNLPNPACFGLPPPPARPGPLVRSPVRPRCGPAPVFFSVCEFV